MKSLARIFSLALLVCLGIGNVFAFQAGKFANAQHVSSDRQSSVPIIWLFVQTAFAQTRDTTAWQDASIPTGAAPITPWRKPDSDADSASSGGVGGTTTVLVTEKIPGVHCPRVGGDGPDSRLYKCSVGRGFSTVMSLLSGLIKYGTFITILVGVLMLVASGIQISMSGIDSGGREAAKKRVTQVLVGLAFLFLVAGILNTVAPWVYS